MARCEFSVRLEVKGWIIRFGLQYLAISEANVNKNYREFKIEPTRDVVGGLAHVPCLGLYVLVVRVTVVLKVGLAKGRFSLQLL